MRPARLTVRQDETEIFDRAVRDGALAAVTLQEDGVWHSFKCRFLERDPNRRFFVLDYEPQHGETLPPVSLGQYVGVSFRHSSRKIMFASIVEARGKFRCGDNRQVNAVRYRWPQGITELQRRAFYRTPLPDSMSLLAHLWSGGVVKRAAADGETFRVTSGHVADISCGGALVRLRPDCEPAWNENETLGVEMELADGRPPVQLDAHFRGIRQDNQGKRCAAIQFVGLEVSVDGRLVLERLCRVVQRLHRMAMSAGGTRHAR